MIRKLLLFCFLSILLIQCSNSIDRQKAKQILQNSEQVQSFSNKKYLKLALYEDNKILVTYDESFVNLDSIQSDFNKFLSCLESKNLIEYQNNGFKYIRDIKLPAYFYGDDDMQGVEYSIQLTKKGKKNGIYMSHTDLTSGGELIRRLSEVVIPFDYLLTIEKVTGIKLNEDEGTAKVEFSTVLKPNEETCGNVYSKTSISSLKTIYVNNFSESAVHFPNKLTSDDSAILSLYDDGWRLESINRKYS